MLRVGPQADHPRPYVCAYGRVWLPFPFFLPFLLPFASPFFFPLPLFPRPPLSFFLLSFLWPLWPSPFGLGFPSPWCPLSLCGSPWSFWPFGLWVLGSGAFGPGWACGFGRPVGLLSPALAHFGALAVGGVLVSLGGFVLPVEDASSAQLSTSAATFSRTTSWSRCSATQLHY